MVFPFRRLLPAALGVAIAVCPIAASAQQRSPLAAPTIAASVAAAADWTTTYHALKYYQLREVNPLLQPWQRSPGTLISVGALIDAGSISGWNLIVGGAHPTVAAAGLWGMVAFRAYLAIHNLHNERVVARR